MNHYEKVVLKSSSRTGEKDFTDGPVNGGCMGFRINTNVPSLTAQHKLTANKDKLEHTQDRISSGSRIIRASDDATGLAISERMRATLRSTEQNIKESQNGIYMLQTTEGALGYMTNILIRMKELATSAASDTNGENERHYLDNEVQALKNELDRLSRATKFNGRALLTGDGGEIEIQVGPQNDPETDRIILGVDFRVDTTTLGLTGLEVGTKEGAQDSLEKLLDSIDYISGVRGKIGASESALTNTISNLRQYLETLSGAYSQIRDADIAYETAEMAKYNILTQAGVAILSQVNATPAQALKLLGS